MAIILNRDEAYNKAVELGKQFINAFNQIIDKTDAIDKEIYYEEMTNAYRTCTLIRIEPKNIPLSVGDLICWFFRAGQQKQELISEDKLDMYGELVYQLMTTSSNLSIKEIMEQIINE